MNHVVLSSTPIDWNFARWRRTLDAYRIDGRQMLDPSSAEYTQGMARLMALESLTQPDAARTPADLLEPCAQVLARTAGQTLVTDDNMGTEWRHFWDQQ